jgi:dihydropteroate synthase
MQVGSVSIDASPAHWLIRGRAIPTDRPVVLGVLNLTPDSFSDGGSYTDAAQAVARAVEMTQAGADLIDVGGESTRPGAVAVDAETEWRRIGRVVEQLSDRGILVSVDTTKSLVARRAVAAGAVALNDVSGLVADPAMGEVAAESGAGLVLMHMRGTPGTMQRDVEYADLLGEVKRFLTAALRRAESAGCQPAQLAVDPGIGFGKSVHGNLELIAKLGALADLERPILVGPSRKSFIGRILNVPVGERMEGTIAACTAALERGARLFRVHDVKAARRALDVAWAIRNAGQ